MNTPATLLGLGALAGFIAFVYTTYTVFVTGTYLDADAEAEDVQRRPPRTRPRPHPVDAMPTGATLSRLVAERAVAVAVVYLTRRDDVRVLGAGRDRAIDVFVRLGDEANARDVGVVVQGAAASTDSSDVRVRREAFDVEVAVPVLLMHVAMREGEDDVLRYAWLREPVVAPDGTRRLRPASETLALEPLTRAALDDLVAQVARWYAAAHAEAA
jgi:hypothetical protein